MPAGKGPDIGWIATTTLDGVVAHFAASEVQLPDRRVIAPGQPRLVAWDCAAVLVTCGGIGWGQGPGTGSGTARPTGNPVAAGARHTVIAVQIVRWVPESDGTNPPDADELTAAGLEVMRDAGLLSQALVDLCGPSGPFKKLGTAIAGAVEILGPSGFMAASEGNLTITAGNLL